MRPTHDRWLLVTTLALMATGLVMIYSASAVQAAELYANPHHYLQRQLLFALLSLGLLAVSARVPPASLRSLAVPVYLLSLVLLALVLVPGIGLHIGGARRWLGAGTLRMQPSEPARLALVLVLAHVLAVPLRRSRDPRSRLATRVALALAALPALLVLAEPDLGTAVILGSLTLALLFLAAVPARTLLRLCGGLALVLCILLVSADYRLRRLLAFLFPEMDPLGSGYQVQQSLLAVGLGGVDGVGLGNGTQKLFYLPAAHTDFIFAVLAEETGLSGALLVLLLLALLLQRGLAIARRQREPFFYLLAAGLTTSLGLCALINLGAVLSLLPATGVALPFVSYGGSALLCHSCAVGLLLSLSRENA